MPMPRKPLAPSPERQTSPERQAESRYNELRELIPVASPLLNQLQEEGVDPDQAARQVTQPIKRLRDRFGTERFESETGMNFGRINELRLRALGGQDPETEAARARIPQFLPEDVERDEAGNIVIDESGVPKIGGFFSKARMIRQPAVAATGPVRRAAGVGPLSDEVVAEIFAQNPGIIPQLLAEEDIPTSHPNAEELATQILQDRASFQMLGSEIATQLPVFAATGGFGAGVARGAGIAGGIAGAAGGAGLEEAALQGAGEIGAGAARQPGSAARIGQAGALGAAAGGVLAGGGRAVSATVGALRRPIAATSGEIGEAVARGVDVPTARVDDVATILDDKIPEQGASTLGDIAGGAPSGRSVGEIAAELEPEQLVPERVPEPVPGLRDLPPAQQAQVRALREPGPAAPDDELITTPQLERELEAMRARQGQAAAAVEEAPLPARPEPQTSPRAARPLQAAERTTLEDQLQRSLEEPQAQTEQFRETVVERFRNLDPQEQQTIVGVGQSESAQRSYKKFVDRAAQLINENPARTIEVRGSRLVVVDPELGPLRSPSTRAGTPTQRKKMAQALKKLFRQERGSIGDEEVTRVIGPDELEATHRVVESPEMKARIQQRAIEQGLEIGPPPVIPRRPPETARFKTDPGVVEQRPLRLDERSPLERLQEIEEGKSRSQTRRVDMEPRIRRKWLEAEEEIARESGPSNALNWLEDTAPTTGPRRALDNVLQHGDLGNVNIMRADPETGEFVIRAVDRQGNEAVIGGLDSEDAAWAFERQLALHQAARQGIEQPVPSPQEAIAEATTALNRGDESAARRVLRRTISNEGGSIDIQGWLELGKWFVRAPKRAGQGLKAMLPDPQSPWLSNPKTPEAKELILTNDVSLANAILQKIKANGVEAGLSLKAATGKLPRGVRKQIVENQAEVFTSPLAQGDARTVLGAMAKWTNKRLLAWMGRVGQMTYKMVNAYDGISDMRAARLREELAPLVRALSRKEARGFADAITSGKLTPAQRALADKINELDNALRERADASGFVTRDLDTEAFGASALAGDLSDFPLKMRTNPKRLLEGRVLNRLRRDWERVLIAQIFGPPDQGGMPLFLKNNIDAIKSGAAFTDEFDQDTLTRLADAYSQSVDYALGLTANARGGANVAEQRGLSTLRAWMGAFSLRNLPIKNAGEIVKVVTGADAQSLVKGVYKLARPTAAGRATRRELRLSGVIESSQRFLERELNDPADLTEGVRLGGLRRFLRRAPADITRNVLLVPQSEAAVRAMTANSYVEYAEKLARSLGKRAKRGLREGATPGRLIGIDDETVRLRLADLVGVDRLDSIIQRAKTAKKGDQILTPNERRWIMRRAVQETQPTGSFGTPAAWQTPRAKTMLQFQSFALTQQDFMKDRILRELGRGNAAPLLKFVAATQAVGLGVAGAMNWLTGRPGEKDFPRKFFNNIMVTGGFGLYADVLHAVSQFGVETTPMSPFTRLITAPSISMLGDVFRAIGATSRAPMSTKVARDPLRTQAGLMWSPAIEIGSRLGGLPGEIAFTQARQSHPEFFGTPRVDPPTTFGPAELVLQRLEGGPAGKVQRQIETTRDALQDTQNPRIRQNLQNRLRDLRQRKAQLQAGQRGGR